MARYPLMVFACDMDEHLNLTDTHIIYRVKINAGETMMLIQHDVSCQTNINNEIVIFLKGEDRYFVVVKDITERFIVYDGS